MKKTKQEVMGTPKPWTAKVLERQGFAQYPTGYKTIIDLDATFNAEDQGRGIRSAGTLIVFGPEGEANAAHIVRCVNTHDELIEALKQTVKTIEAQYADGVSEYVRLIAQRALELIRKAEGGDE